MTAPTSDFRLLSASKGDDIAAVGPTRTYAELEADALRVGSAISGGTGAVLVHCEDRYWFAVALLGAWSAGRVAALPPMASDEAVREFATAGRFETVLHDGRDIRGLDVREGEQHERAAPRALPVIEPGRALVTLHTSGTTGSGTTWTKRAAQLFSEVRVLREHFELTSSDCIVTTVPPRHIYGLLFGVLLPLHLGARLVRSTDLLPDAVFRLVALHGATVLVSTPAHLRALSASATGALRALRVVFSSGAPLSHRAAGALAAATSARVVEVLGSTETGGIAWRQSGEDEWQTLPTVSVRADTDGRLVVRSPFCDDSEGETLTRDRIELVSDDRFLHHGRDDGVIKIGGKRLSLQELEACTLALPGVTDAAALSDEIDGLRGHEVRLAVVAPSWTAEGIRRALSLRFDRAVLPRRIRLVDALPRTPSGKVARDALRALLSEPQAPRLPTVVTKVETALEDANRCLVEIEIPVDSRYFEGHFPGQPIFPGVAILTAIVLPEVEARWPALDRATEVRRLDFSAPIEPGARLILELSRQGDAPEVDFRLERADGGACARGTLVFDVRACVTA